MWVIILTGVIFIGSRFYKVEDDSINQLTNVETNEKDKDIVKIDGLDIPKEGDKTYQEYLTNAESFFKSGDFAKAVLNYEKAVKANPNSPELIAALGESYLKNNQPDKAKKAFSAALKLNSTSTVLKLGLARAHLNSREIEEANEIIAILDTSNPEVIYYQGIIKILYRKFDDAKTLFKKVATMEPKASDTLLKNTAKFLASYDNFDLYPETDKLYLELMLAKNLTDIQEYKAAIPVLYDIINTKNNYRDAWIVLGFAYLNSDKPKEAIDALEQAKELTPAKPETLFFLGLSYFADNQIDKAIHYVELADKNGFEPKEQIELKLGDLYLLKQDYQKSAENYESLLTKNTDKIDVFTRAIWLNIDKLNNPENGLEIAQKAVEIHPDKAMSFNLLGWAYTAMEDYDNAEKNLQIALSMDPKLDAVHLNLGWLYEKNGQETLAKEYYKKAYQIGKNNSIASLAAVRYNKLNDQNSQKSFQVNTFN